MKFSYSLIKKLFPKAPPKQKLADGLNMFSFETSNSAGDVFEVALPPNRYSDAASHLGIAREAGAIFGGKFSARGGSAFGRKNPVRTIVNPPANKGFIKLEVTDQKLCPRYSARYFELKNEIKESPRFIQDVLRSCGLKPINGVVDIINYAMLETGQPLHAFDADQLANPSRIKSNKSRMISHRIVVRRAKKGERIKTLDGATYYLDPEVLVVAAFGRHSRKFGKNSGNILAIAGIKGGEDSGVGQKTRRIIVEAANFDPVFTYKAARKLKLSTDASLRFSHGISPALVDWGMDRATELLLKTGAWLLDTVDYYPRPAGDEVIEFSPAKYESVIGAPVDAKRAQQYFAALGFSIEPPKKRMRDPSAFLARIPAWRVDLEEQEDLIEEVARLEGYGKLRPRAPAISAFPAHQGDIVNLKERIRRILVGFQLDEVYNSSFVGKGQIADGKWFGATVAAVEVENPIAEDKKYLRSSLAPLLIKNAEDNARFYEVVRIFEIGKVFSFAAKGVKEKLSLGILLAAKKEPKLVLEAKGIADELMRGLGIDDFSIVSAGESLRVEVGHNVLGLITYAALEKGPPEARLAKGGWHAAFAEFDLDKIMQFTEEAKEFIPLKRFPSVLRDISVLVSPEARVGDIMQDIQLASPKLIENVDLVDEYIPESKDGGPSTTPRASRQSLTFRIIFQAEDRTLTDEEVNREMEKIAEALKKGYGAEIR